MYIKVFTDGAAVIISEERDRPCSNPQGHDFNPESGAPFGHNGNCCAHCGHFVGRHEEMRDAAEAQAYAQAMLGATGPVEVREIEWKWGPGDVPKSPVVRKIADASGAPVIELPIHEDDEVRHA